LKTIRRGDAAAIVTGGSKPYSSRSSYAGFVRCGPSRSTEDPTQASRPCRSRPGPALWLSEGAGALLLEELEHASAVGRASTRR